MWQQRSKELCGGVKGMYNVNSNIRKCGLSTYCAFSGVLEPTYTALKNEQFPIQGRTSTDLAVLGCSTFEIVLWRGKPWDDFTHSSTKWNSKGWWEREGRNERLEGENRNTNQESTFQNNFKCPFRLPISHSHHLCISSFNKPLLDSHLLPCPKQRWGHRNQWKHWPSLTGSSSGS